MSIAQSASDLSPQLQPGNEPSLLNLVSLPPSETVIEPLPRLQRNGLIAVSSLALVSLIATFSLLVFLTHRFIFWRTYYRRPLSQNQYAVLIYNLALADLQQGLGFIISLRWIATNSLHATDVSCFLQGIWLQIGDPMSGVFVLSIAVHTFLHIILNYQLPYRVFVAGIVALWVLGVVMVIIPIAVVGRYVWLPAVAWCWIPDKYPALRLWTHYFWIFVAQAFTVLVYIIMFIQLRRRIIECVRLGGRNTDSLRRLNRVVSYLVLYPIFYITLTMPLAVGRMATASGHPPSITYFCIAGSLMTLSGLCDTLLYTLSRKNSIFGVEQKLTTDAESSRFTLRRRKRRRSTLSNVRPSARDPWGAISTFAAVGSDSDANVESVPNGAFEYPAVVQSHQDVTIDRIPEPVRPMCADSSSSDGWNASRERV